MFGPLALAQLAAEMGAIVAAQQHAARKEAQMDRDRYESLYLSGLLSGNEPATERYQGRLRGIERRWDQRARYYAAGLHNKPPGRGRSWSAMREIGWGADA